MGKMTGESKTSVVIRAPGPKAGETRRIEQQDRLSCHFSLHAIRSQKKPVGVIRMFGNWLENKEQAYQRDIDLGEDLVPLDLGWIKNPGMVCITNDTGRKDSSNPVEHEPVKEQIVDIYTSEGAQPLVVRPGMFLMFEVADHTLVKLRCRKGVALIGLLVYPR